MSASYQKFSGLCAILAGTAGLLYLGLFVVLKNPAALLPTLALLFVGIFVSAVIVVLYQIGRSVDESFALWGLLLGIIGVGGSAIHAAFDMANALHPPSAPFVYPNPVDPRGFSTFAITGLATIIFSWLILRGSVLPRTIGYLGVVSGLLLILLYLAYLVLLNALSPIVLILIFVTGVLQPLFYLGIGWVLLQREIHIPATL